MIAEHRHWEKIQTVLLKLVGYQFRPTEIEVVEDVVTFYGPKCDFMFVTTTSLEQILANLGAAFDDYKERELTLSA